MKILGLTGQSGAGKTLFAKELMHKGYPCVNADKLYHSLLIPPSNALDAIRREFGNSVFFESGELNRRALAKEVFSNEKKLDALNAAVLPIVIDEIKKIAKEHKKNGVKLLVVDAPTLFESGFGSDCDMTVAFIAPAELRIKRIAERDGLTVEEATLRTNAQKRDEFYTARADKIIINDKDESDLSKKADEILAELLGEDI